MPEDRDAMMSPEQVADWLLVTPDTVYRWLREGRLPALRLGRVYRIPRAEVLALVKSRGEED